MSTDTAQHNGRPAGASPSPAALEREVERNREELARTVDALHHKLDVKAQAKQRAQHLRSSATTADGRPRPQLLAAAGGVVAAVGLLVWLRRR